MKKLVIKTIFITVLAILIVCTTVMSAICVFNPRTIAKMFDNFGNYEASQYFYVRQYEKTKEIGDLIVLIDNAYEKQDENKLTRYVLALIMHKDFKAYCQDQNSKLSIGQMTTEEYYAGLYAELLMVTKTFDSALTFAKSYVVKSDGSINAGYTKFNPFRVLVDSSAQLLISQKQTIKQELHGFFEVITDSIELGYMQEDLNKLN